MSAHDWRTNLSIELQMAEARAREETLRQKEILLERRRSAMRREHRNAWRSIGIDIKVIPDAAYPWDPAVLRAIHEFDQNIIPLMVTKAYQAQTGEIRLFHFHAIGSHLWNPSERPAEWTSRVEMPTSGNWKRPTHMDLHLENRTVEARPVRGLPGGYMPFDWGVYHGLREQYQDWDAAQKLAYLAKHSPWARAEAERIKIEADRETAARSDRSLARHLKNIDRRDMERVVAKTLYPPTRVSVTVPGGPA